MFVTHFYSIIPNAWVRSILSVKIEKFITNSSFSKTKCPLHASNFSKYCSVLCFKLVFKIFQIEKVVLIKMQHQYSYTIKYLCSLATEYFNVFFLQRYLANVTFFVIWIFIYDLSNIPSTLEVINAVRLAFIHNASLRLHCSHNCIYHPQNLTRTCHINPPRLIGPLTNTFITMTAFPQ